MIKAFILYYLNIKPTHGYEIQKFIQFNQMDNWTKIQSGSIYYALGKLEKEGLIDLYKEESIGAKVRKLYKINQKGKAALSEYLKEEIDKEIYEVGSDKFVIYPILDSIEKDVLAKQVSKHIKGLQEKRVYLTKWQSVKISAKSLKVEKVCFEMMISSLDYQIKWHEALLEEIDGCMQLSQQITDFIRKIDFSTIEEKEDIFKNNEATDIEKLKQEILTNPETASDKLEELIKLMKK